MARARDSQRIDGVLLVDKPVGPSSNAVLQHVKRLFGAQRAGHTGTLDPLASGLLPICLGEATKFGSHLLEADKAYIATIRLGIRTETGDAEGRIVESLPAINIDGGRLELVLNSFRGETEQIPPMHSALKKYGQPLYKLARQGVNVERPPRKVSIARLELRNFGDACATVYVRCSKGTYVRTLAEDIGTQLGCGAHLEQLRRVEVGVLDVRSAVDLERLDSLDTLARMQCLLPVDHLVSALPRLDLAGEESRKFEHGREIDAPVRSHPVPAGLVRVYGEAGHFCGVGEVNPQSRLLPRRLVSSAEAQGANSG